MKYIFMFVATVTVLGGGIFFYNNNYKKTIPVPVTKINMSDTVQASSTAGTNEQPASTSTNVQSAAKVDMTTSVSADPARANAVIKVQAQIVEWKNTYKNDCVNKETVNNECPLLKKGIEKMEALCLQGNLTGSEVIKCGENILGEVLQSALLLKSSGVSTPATKSNVDSHGTDLALLPEGQTVKIFKNGPTDEVSYGNETTVTYTRTGDTVKISEVIVYEGGNGRSSFSRTVSLK